MEQKIVFTAYDVISAFTPLDDFLWALDVPLNHVCLNSKDGNNSLFPGNYSIKDWKFFHRFMKPSDSSMLNINKALIENIYHAHPEYKDEVTSLFYNEDGYCKIENNRIVTNYQKSYEVLNLV